MRQTTLIAAILPYLFVMPLIAEPQPDLAKPDAKKKAAKSDNLGVKPTFTEITFLPLSDPGFFDDRDIKIEKSDSTEPGKDFVYAHRPLFVFKERDTSLKIDGEDLPEIVIAQETLSGSFHRLYFDVQVSSEETREYCKQLVLEHSSG